MREHECAALLRAFDAARQSGRSRRSTVRKRRCLFKARGANRPCMPGNRPSSPLPPAGCRARLPLCGCPGRRRARCWSVLAGRLPPPRAATRVLLHDAARQPIDDAVVLWFPGPASATGEDVAEFHVHGGRAVLAALFAALSAICRRSGGGAGRVHPARLRERQARSDRGGSTRRSDPCRHRSPTPPGVAPAQRLARRSRAGLAGAQIIEASALIEAEHRFFRRGRRADRADRAGAAKNQDAARRDRGSACGAGTK